jgi:uncharacterized protein (DUF2062 family)
VTRPLHRLLDGLRSVWERAKREHSSPREIGLSVGVGAFVACTPFVGFHLWMALALATVLRLSRLWAMIGSRLSTTPIFVLTTFAEIQLSHRVRTGAWVPITVRDVLTHGPELVIDWALGSVVVGAVIAVLAGTVAAAIAQRWRPVSPRALAALRPPTSESPP